MKKRLTKSSNNVVITGVLAGIADYFGIDPTIVRVIYVVLSFFSTGFPGFLLYIALAVLIPSGRNKKNSYYDYNRNVRKENPYTKNSKQRKEAESVDDDEWSDF